MSQNIFIQTIDNEAPIHFAWREPRILFVGEAVSLAHVGRPAILARWALETGYEVKIACGDALAQVVRGEGLEPISLETIAPKTFYARLDTGRFFYTQEELEKYVTAERTLIRREHPDLIVGDFRLTLAISACLEGVPLLSLQQAHWSPVSLARFPAPTGGPLGLLPPTFRQQVFEAIRPIAYRNFAAPLDAVRERFGMKRLRDFRLNYTDGDFCAYLDLPELVPLGALPRGHYFLGPLHWAPRSGGECSKGPYEDTDGNCYSRPLAYVSMGSSGDENLLPTILQALADKGFQAAVSGVQRLVDSTYPGVRFLGTLNPSAILQEAALTICHGGAGTVYQSLSSGVPVLCLPSNPDQQLMARAVEQFGAGRCLPAELGTAQRLYRAIEETASENCREATSRLALAIDTHDTRGRWLAWLEKTLRPVACQRIRRAISSGNMASARND